MIVRIHFGRGHRVTQRRGKNGRAALLLASMLSLVAISFAVFGLWRLGEDLGFTADFVFPTGFLSHWQVWIAAAASTQYVCWRLTRYSRLARLEADATEKVGAPVEKVSARV
jgi:hypothetical protein